MRKYNVQALTLMLYTCASSSLKKKQGTGEQTKQKKAGRPVRPQLDVSLPAPVPRARTPVEPRAGTGKKGPAQG